MKPILTYLKQVREELSKVSWPTKTQVVRSSLIVIVASVIVGIYISGVDYIFTRLLGFVIK